MKMRVLAVMMLVATVPCCVVAQAPRMEAGGHAHKLGPVSTALTVTIEGKAKAFTMNALKALPQEEVKVFDKHANRDMVWSGPSVSSVFAACGMPFSKDAEHDILHRYVFARGTDDYWNIFSAGEMMEEFSGIKYIVALARDGQPLGQIGEFVLFNNQDKLPARRISNLSTIEVKSYLGPDKK